MEDSVKDRKSKISSFFRHRSPTFSKQEIQALLTLVEKHKSVILNKSTNNAANHAKDTTWLKIAKKFNSQGLGYTRNAESLKMKWDNLKRELKKVTNNLVDMRSQELDDVYSQIIAIMSDEVGDGQPPVSDDDEDVEPSKTTSSMWDNNKDSDESLDGVINENSNENHRLLNQATGFSTQDCNLLLQCVRQEKDIVFSNINTNTSGEYRLSHHRLKDKAWKRIAHSYNKLSPQKRSTNALRKKFQNMRTMATKVNLRKCVSNLSKKCSFELEGTVQKIKKEPVFEVMEDDVSDESNDEVLNDRTDVYEANSSSISLDPLETARNTKSENKDVTNEELLNYKMETAKLERKRIEDLIAADKQEREAKALETSYRLRAARLEVAAAEMKLPLNHPALVYTAEETNLQYTQYNR